MRTNLLAVEADDAFDEDRPLFAWIPPDDRLWRHPSETGPNPLVGHHSRPSRSFVRNHGRTLAVAIVSGVVGALVASGIGFAAGGFNSRLTTVIQPVTRLMTPDTVAMTSANSSGASWPAVADAVAPSVAEIEVKGLSGTAIGSGVLYAAGSQRSYLLTDQALVSPGDSIQVAFNGGKPRPGKLVGTDAKTGIALVSVAGSNRGFPLFGSIAGVKEAEPVLAVGAQTGDGASVVAGSISAVDQQVVQESGSTMLGMLAVSASPSPASVNGGALVDREGVVIGINVPVSTSDPTQSGLSYAVPIDVAAHVAQQLLAGRRPTHPWLGVTGAVDLSSAKSRQLGVSGGAQVEALVQGSPAARAGVALADIIVSFNHRPVTSTGALIASLQHTQPGQRVEIAFIHNGKRLTRVVTIGHQPANLSQN